MYDIEPSPPSKRLAWHISRLREWLVAASENRLNQNGDPFELPHFPSGQTNPEIAFNEDQTSFNFWQNNKDTYGLVDFSNPLGNHSVLAAICFRTKNGKQLWAAHFGDAVPTKVALTGLWIRASAVPHILPWQAPTTLRELSDALSKLGTNLDLVLQEMAKHMRDGNRHPILIGFPIPSVIGQPEIRFHWQGLLLPEFSNGDTKGFRPTEKSYHRRDQSLVFRPSLNLEWLSSQNWEAGEIGSRGMLGDDIRSKRILIIGAGAIGSMVSEILVREGCRDLVVIDYQKLEIGNLTRHTVGLDAIATRKVDALSARLKTVNPHVRVATVPTAFPPPSEKDIETICSCNLIIDCTADDTALHSMEAFDWKSEKQFFSISVALYARRMFLFHSIDKTFPQKLFTEKIQPWIEKDLEEYRDVELPREGIGCWHPVFPARADDLWLTSSIAAKRIAEIVGSSASGPALEVFEQQIRGGQTEGFHKVA